MVICRGEAEYLLLINSSHLRRAMDSLLGPVEMAVSATRTLKEFVSRKMGEASKYACLQVVVSASEGKIAPPDDPGSGRCTCSVFPLRRLLGTRRVMAPPSYCRARDYMWSLSSRGSLFSRLFSIVVRFFGQR